MREVEGNIHTPRMKDHNHPSSGCKLSNTMQLMYQSMEFNTKENQIVLFWRDWTDGQIHSLYAGVILEQGQMTLMSVTEVC
jgi:uncharacterized protein YigE (DUF2233 family)